jgi:hypothetical protein
MPYPDASRRVISKAIFLNEFYTRLSLLSILREYPVSSRRLITFQKTSSFFSVPLNAVVIKLLRLGAINGCYNYSKQESELPKTGMTAGNLVD